MNAAHPTIGVGLEFDAIAAVILGGTSFEKGHGGIAGTIVGALAVGVLRNGLNLLGVGLFILFVKTNWTTFWASLMLKIYFLRCCNIKKLTLKKWCVKSTISPKR